MLSIKTFIFTVVLSFVGLGFVEPAEQISNHKLYKTLLHSAVQVRTYPPYDKDIDRFSHGTGWIRHTKKGETYIYTAAHVLSTARTTANHFPGKVIIAVKQIEDGADVGDSYYQAEVVRYSHHPDGEDLCILRIQKHKLLKQLEMLKDDKQYPKLGDRLYLAGATGGSTGGLYVSEGTLGRRGVLLQHEEENGLLYKPRMFDYANMSALPGCSGGPVTDKNGIVVGMLTRGRSECHSFFIPVKRIKTWAKKVGMEFTLDSTIEVPTDDEIASYPIEEKYTYSREAKPVKESKGTILDSVLNYFKLR